MSALSDTGGETDAVLAFMRERQGAVLTDAIAQLSTCSSADLRAVIHALTGSVGSYQLDAAAQAIAGLATVVASGEATGEQIEAARRQAVADLRTIEAERTT